MAENNDPAITSDPKPARQVQVRDGHNPKMPIDLGPPKPVQRSSLLAGLSGGTAVDD
jgi:hypothetical protein